MVLQIIINLLKKNGEKYIDEFPIVIENGKYYYTYDENIKHTKPIDIVGIQRYS